MEVNGGPHNLETRYVVTGLPRLGRVERRGPGGLWKPVSSFSQRSVDAGRVRFRSTSQGLRPENVTDHFTFQVAVEGRVSGELAFPVAVRGLKLALLRNVALETGAAGRRVLASDRGEGGAASRAGPAF